MSELEQPAPLSASAYRYRLRRINATSKNLGFVGTADYRHVCTQSDGAKTVLGHLPTRKATAELTDMGLSPENTVLFVERLRRLLRDFL